ncbi:MAG TPA: DUF4185 domain-containing protein [Ignavibacteriaceae bacterium]|nr:DUF4185 domain-containing protein [Ignavibacteriaceae bacterium]
MKEIKIFNARDLGPQFVNNSNKMVGQDGAYSIPLEKDKCLFFFGDTLIGKRTEGESLWYPGGQPLGPVDMTGVGGLEKMITNTGLLCYNKTGENGFDDFEYILGDDGQLKQLLPHLDDEDINWYRIWCLHGVTIKDKVYLFFIKIKMLEEGEPPANFVVLGSGLTVGNAKDWKFERIYKDGSYIIWYENDPCFASAICYLPGDDYVYLYGTKNDRSGIHNLHLARAKPDEMDKVENYRYFVSEEEGWTEDVKKSKPLFAGMPNELSVNYNKYLGCYLSIHSLELSGKIVARTSPTPWGPWSEPIELWQVVPQKRIEGPTLELIYAAKEHPYFSKDNGKTIYITYIEFEEYYPHLIEITFE